MAVHTLATNEHTTKRLSRAQKLSDFSATNPFMKDQVVRKAVLALLDDKPKTGDDILEILGNARGKLAIILKILENPKLVADLGIRPSAISKVELMSAAFEKEIIDRDVPLMFLCTMENQKTRAKAYSLWKGMEEYIKIVGRARYSPYMVHIAYAAFALHKLGISPKQISESFDISINEKKYKIDHGSFLSMAKHCHDMIWDGVKKHKIQTDSDINAMLKEIDSAWNREQKNITKKSGNAIYVDFRK